MRLQLLLVLFQLSLHCLRNLAHPCSCSSPLLGCVVRVDPSVSMRARAFTSQPYSNSSLVGDRPHTCVDKPWSSLVTPGQPEHAQICHCRSYSRHGRDLRHTPHSLISSRADLALKSQCVMSSAPADEIDTQFNAFSTFAIHIVFSREPSSASCVVTATACS